MDALAASGDAAEDWMLRETARFSWQKSGGREGERARERLTVGIGNQE
jgi:hypothetical protein